VPGDIETSQPPPDPGSLTAAGLPQGLDYQALLEAMAVSGALNGDPEIQDAELADHEAATEDGRMSPCDPARVAALAVEHMDPGPAQAAWLGVAAAAADQLDENELAGVAIAARQLASWAQATELMAVAQITARAAAADPRIGVEADGRPVRLCRDALGQVSLALMLTGYGASWWADLAITLAWRLPATGAALARGAIDFYRARLIAEATAVLPEDAARAVEQQILPGAGQMTSAQLRARLRHEVIAADPNGAEQRREQAERQAKVSLYGDEDGTATLAGSRLPAVHAAAAMARITAIARAMQAAAGHAGGLDLHRAHVMLGLLLGTLPYIPPAEGAPPDQPPLDGPGASPGGPGPADAGGGPGHDDPASPADGDGPGGCDPDRNPGRGEGPWDDLPAPRDEDAPPDDGLDDEDADDRASDRSEEDADLPATAPTPIWPALGAIPPALARCPGVQPGDHQPPDGRPVPGLLDLLLPWSTLAGSSDRPGILGRIGPVTAAQARLLAGAAEDDPATQWRMIVTNAAGQAMTVTRIRRPRRRARDGPAGPRDGPPPGTGLVGRITLTISERALIAAWQPSGVTGSGPRAGPGPPVGIAAAALRAATRALSNVKAQAEADQAAGGCAHASESPAYRPPPRLREQVTARDVTCRNPACRQPAWRADLDHTLDYDHGGRTCPCNLGGVCRGDHQLKQHPRWKLEQIRPGVFRWTTIAGRTYIAGPGIYDA
jgi:Domain of unknown function (DUF222)